MPFPTLGILGGGQLGRMTALAAIPLGIHVRFLVPQPASGVADFADVMVGDWTDADVLRRFADGCDAVTVESEWAPAELLRDAAPEVPVWPSPETLAVIRDKGLQKQALAAAGLPLPAFEICHSPQEAVAAAERLGYPVVMKKPRGSYDGYGNVTVRDESGMPAAWDELGNDGSVIVEAWVEFTRELAVLIARSPDGRRVTYPVVETEQRDHRLHAAMVPSAAGDRVESNAIDVATRAVEAVRGVGITAVELFETREGKVLVNELAPRPHNSGHFSIEACHTSQFENHARAVLGLPLGDPSLRVPAACTVNVLGQRSASMQNPSGWHSALTQARASVHLYGKEDVRPQRKMGHVTVTGHDRDEVRQRAEEAAGMVTL